MKILLAILFLTVPAFADEYALVVDGEVSQVIVADADYIAKRSAENPGETWILTDAKAGKGFEYDSEKREIKKPEAEINWGYDRAKYLVDTSTAVK